MKPEEAINKALEAMRNFPKVKLFEISTTLDVVKTSMDVTGGLGKAATGAVIQLFQNCDLDVAHDKAQRLDEAIRNLFDKYNVYEFVNEVTTLIIQTIFGEDAEFARMDLNALKAQLAEEGGEDDESD